MKLYWDHCSAVWPQRKELVCPQLIPRTYGNVTGRSGLWFGMFIFLLAAFYLLYYILYILI